LGIRNNEKLPQTSFTR